MELSAAALASLLGSLAAAAGLAFLGIQIRDSRRLARAEFISSLENDLVGHYCVYRKLLPGEIWSPDGTGPGDMKAITEIVPYLGFFAKIKFLLDVDAINLELVDRMFVFRFFLAVHNVHVQTQILYADLYSTYWSEIFVLHRDWVKFRRERGLPIPFDETNLEEYAPDRYKEMLRAWRIA